jgi:hypothetical protein
MSVQDKAVPTVICVFPLRSLGVEPGMLWEHNLKGRMFLHFDFTF